MSNGDGAVNSRAKATLLLAFCSSLVVHGVAYASLVRSTVDRPPPPLMSTVSFEVQAPPPAQPLPTPKIPEAPAPRSVSPAPAHAFEHKVPQLPPALAATPPKSAATPLDLSGVTLTNDTGAGFAMPVGDGSAIRGPVGLGGAPAAPPSVPPTRGAAGPLLVAASDLSEHPRAPALEGLLRANYPEEARQRGLRGAASVRARIDADGVIRTARLVSETSPGFGSACQRTVIGSRWSPPRAQNGNAVATEIVYTCHFEVD